MPTIYADSSDGWISSGGSHSTWTSARDAGTGNTVDANDNFTQLGAGVIKTAVKGGGNTFEVVRAFFRFDFSGVSGTVDSGATLSIRGYTSTGSPQARIIRSNAFTGGSGQLVVADFDALPGFSSGNSMSGNVADFSSTIVNWNASGWNDFTLNATAISEINANNELIVCLVEKYYDYENNSPGDAGTVVDGTLQPAWSDKKIGITWRDRGSATAPHIDYTVTSGYGHKVNDVAPANIKFINSVQTGDIDKVNDV